MIRLTLIRVKPAERQELYFQSVCKALIVAWLDSFNTWDSVDIEFGLTKESIQAEIFDATAL